MPLLGQAAILLSFDIARDAIPEHDHWHSHEHLPERLSIPGFLRGSRWVASRGGPRYLVLYELEQLAALNSDAYLKRLNNPTPWTSKMMPHYQGMTRGLCAVTGSAGSGLGGACLLLRFKPTQGALPALRHWLCDDALPDLAARPGLCSAHFLEGASSAVMTNEQRIRGVDAGIDCALVVTAYDADALAQLEDPGALKDRLVEHGAVDIVGAEYRLAHCLGAHEIDS